MPSVHSLKNFLPNNRLIAGFLIMFSVYLYNIGFDMPGSLQSIIQHTFQLETYQYAFMYSLFSLPNIIVCSVNGLLLDRLLGLELGTIIFSLIAVFGQAVLTLGGFLKVYWVVLVGRFLYGLGSESMSVSLNYYLVVWFRGKELNFLNAIYACVMRFGTSTVFFFAIPLYESFGKLQSNCALGLTFIVFLLIVVLMMILLKLLGWYTFSYSENSPIDKESIKVSHIIKLPATFWLIVFTFALGSTSYVSFVSVSQKYFETKYGLSLEEANRLSSLFTLVSGFAPLIPGILADVVGFDLYILLLGDSVGVVSHLVFLLYNSSPYVPLVLFGVSYAILDTLCWTTLAYAVKPYQLATALGVGIGMTALMNTISPIITGYLFTRFGSYSIFLFFLSCYLISFICTLFAIFLDFRNDRVLIMNVKERRKYFENENNRSVTT